jgi:RNA-binding protein
MNLTGKQRAFLISQSMSLDPIFQIGKDSVTPEYTDAISEAFNKREIIKISVLNNCLDDPKALAEMIAGRTKSTVVKVIGKKIVLYKPLKDVQKRRIDLNKLCIVDPAEKKKK